MFLPEWLWERFQESVIHELTAVKSTRTFSSKKFLSSKFRSHFSRYWFNNYRIIDSYAVLNLKSFVVQINFWSCLEGAGILRKNFFGRVRFFWFFERNFISIFFEIFRFFLKIISELFLKCFLEVCKTFQNYLNDYQFILNKISWIFLRFSDIFEFSGLFRIQNLPNIFLLNFSNLNKNSWILFKFIKFCHNF